MKTYNIGIIGGDGIGPDVVAEGLKVLRAVMKDGSFDCNFVEYPYSGAYYLKTKELVPDKVIDEWRTLDAVFLGAIGHPDVEVGLVERSVILGLRFGLDLYINLRPIKLYSEALCPLKGKGPNDIDLIVVRENTEGEYGQIGGNLYKGTPNEVATSTSIYTRIGVERAIRYGFELARSRSAERNRPGHLTMVDKANAIRPQEIWTRTFAEVGREYPDIKQDHAYVDAFTMLMIQQPEKYDVVVTTNLYGDIITDLGSILQGGIGLAASGNIHPGKTSMFESIHGSAPDIAGQNIACPLGAIMAVSMMMDYLGEKNAAKRIEDSVAYLLSSGKIKSADARSGISTTQMGDMVVEQIQKSAGKEKILMKATDILMEEHRLIESVLNSLETAANRLSAGQVIPMDFFLKAADFIKGFADGHHHKKEEGVLFVAMDANGMSRDTGPVAIMLEEHEEGRRLTRAMREGAEQVQAGDATAMSQVIQNALDYVTLLREHIQKEDNMLFPMADQVIPVGQHQQIMADFNRIEHEETGEGRYEKYLRMVDELANFVT